MSPTQQVTAARVAEVSLAVVVGGVVAALAFFALLAVNAVASSAWIAITIGVLTAVVMDIALRSTRRRYLTCL